MNVTAQGSNPVTMRGVIYGIVGGTSNYTSASGSGIGALDILLYSLTPASSYFVRAFATSTAGTALSTDITFTTLAPSLATVTTTPITIFTATTATGGGGSVVDGGFPIAGTRGIVWSTSTAPTINLTTKSVDSNAGIGTFNSPKITDLLPETKYYVRAYATNSVGTAYGNEITFTTSSLQIGDAYQGGVVAYLLQSGDIGYDANVKHGFIVSLSDLHTGVFLAGQDNPFWGCKGTLLVGATGVAVGGGKQNTLDIVAGCATPLIAARLCDNLVTGGYSDWYLPSRDELHKFSLNLTAITASGLTSFTTNASYWSSTQHSISADYASVEQLSTGVISFGTKDNPYYTRPIRNF